MYFIKGKIRQYAKSFNRWANLPTKRGKEDSNSYKMNVFLQSCLSGYELEDKNNERAC